MRLRLRSITYLAEDINGYELVDPNGRDLPRFEAGAHIGVRLGDDLWRDYSLWNDPAERRRYCIAVLREKLGEASRRIHDELRVGDPVEVSLPRNHFPLAPDAERHLLLAGGIGITPVMAMIAELKRRRADFRLYYCTRSPERTAFRDELDLLAAMGRVVFHHDGGDPAKGLDIAAIAARAGSRHASLLLRAGRDDGRGGRCLGALAGRHRALRIFLRTRRGAAGPARRRPAVHGAPGAQRRRISTCRRGRAFSTCCAGTASRRGRPANSAIAARA